MNILRKYPILFILWIAVFTLIYWLTSNNRIKLNKKCNSDGGVFMPVDIFNCFKLFGFDPNCQSICLDSCPKQTEYFRNLEIIDRFEPRQARELLKLSKLCEPDLDTDNTTFQDLKASKKCATFVFNSINDTFMFPGFCFPEPDEISIMIDTTAQSTNLLEANRENWNLTDDELKNDITIEKHLSFAIVYFLSTFNLDNLLDRILFWVSILLYILIVPWIFYDLMRWLFDWLVYGFFICDYCRDQSYMVTEISKKLASTKPIDTKLDLIKYLYSFILGYLLFISACIYSIIATNQMEKVASDIFLKTYEFKMSDYKYWIIFLAVSTIFFFLMLIVFSKFKFTKKYEIKMDEKYIKMFVASNFPCFRVSDICICKVDDGLSVVFRKILGHSSTKNCVISLIEALFRIALLLFEFFAWIVDDIIALIMIIYLFKYFFYVWIYSTSGFVIFVLVWFGKITYNLARNVFDSFQKVATALWIIEMSKESTPNDSPFIFLFLKYSSIGKFFIFIKYLLLKNVFLVLACLEMAFFEQSSILIFSFSQIYDVLLAVINLPRILICGPKADDEHDEKNNKKRSKKSKSVFGKIKHFIVKTVMYPNNLELFELRNIGGLEKRTLNQIHIDLKKTLKNKNINNYLSNKIVILLFGFRHMGFKLVFYMLIYLGIFTIFYFISDRGLFGITLDENIFSILTLIKNLPWILILFYSFFTRAFSSLIRRYEMWFLANELELFDRLEKSKSVSQMEMTNI